MRKIINLYKPNHLTISLVDGDKKYIGSLIFIGKNIKYMLHRYINNIPNYSLGYELSYENFCDIFNLTNNDINKFKLILLG
jgi:hypothetical protein